MSLDDFVNVLPNIGPSYSRKLEKLEIFTVKDLLWHAPKRYLDFSKTSKISRANPGDIVTIKGKVKSIINQYTRRGRNIQIAEISDQTGIITIVWFNQPYLTTQLKKGSQLSLAGEVTWFGRKKALVSPEYEIPNKSGKNMHTGRLVPIYPETSGISSKWLRSRISQAYLLNKEIIRDYLSVNLRKKLKFPDLITSLNWIHFPKTIDESELGRKRLAFDELLFLQMQSYLKKLDWGKNHSNRQFKINYSEINNFINFLPFSLTKSQKRTVDEILTDLKKDKPMNRLLEGDVGSGKTVISAIAFFASYLNGYQSVIMAPTQILAQQHYKTFNNLFKKHKIRMSLLTSSQKFSDLGRSDIFIGTHSLLQKIVEFENVGIVVIDEQHRFGVKQRSLLIRKSKNGNFVPHVLTMTATPIPRSIALTAYGDLDLSTLDELPKGRLPITTWIIPQTKRDSAYQWVKDRVLKNNDQAFVVCPLIEESDKDTMASVKAASEEYKRLGDIFSNIKIGLLHSKIKKDKKDKILDDFRKGNIKLLVSTPVVEVGIDIPGASIMVIEAAERFGLSQLHQLRGRIGRGSKKSYCLLLSEKLTPLAERRLKALQSETSGFRLSEIDLQLRGPGEVFGIRQHGFPKLKIASWRDIDLIKLSKSITQDIFVKSPKEYLKIYNMLNKYQTTLN